MREYQFWDELGNIFNAIVAYQHKTIEFNKKFVNPWLRLGTVFDQTDHNADVLLAAQKAIEIDCENGSNWLALGDVYFKMGSFDDAASAYSSAIELNPTLGWAYANLALVNATREEYSKAVNLYVKSLEHITDDKDRSMIWNRLGNVYRKVNDYENAFIAFQMADECDGQNTGFDDQLDEVTVEQKVMPIVADVYVNDNARPTPKSKLITEEVEPISEIQVEEEVAVHEDVESFDGNAEDDKERPESVSPIAELQDPGVANMADADASDEQMMEQQIEASISPKSLVTDEEAQSESIEEVVAEGMQTEVVSEIPAMESEADDVISDDKEGENTEFVAEQSAEEPGEEVQLEVSSELSVDETSNEEAQPESTEETNAEKAQTEIASETPIMANILDELQTDDVVEDGQPDAIAEPQLDISAEEFEQSMEVVSTLDVDYDESGSIISTMVMPHGTETFANPLAENKSVVLLVDDLADLFKQADPSEEVEAESQDIETEAQLEIQIEAIDDGANENAQTESNDEQDEVTDVVAKIVAMANANDEVSSAIENDVTSISAQEMENDQPVIDIESTLDTAREPAYEAFLTQATEPVLETAETKFAPVDKLKVEPDTKNAHVWNELGNVYFNTGSYEEAVNAYSKAIELDDWFAWPYSNLALVYVQKENYAEAILLYQRSIELFASDKDKAITWNRLGNVYRRLNDYDNAIACYQRADELDPNNATRSLRSRFSLLGSLSLEESSSVAV